MTEDFWVVYQKIIHSPYTHLSTFKRLHDIRNYSTPTEQFFYQIRGGNMYTKLYTK